jgi:hypothetical protein
MTVLQDFNMRRSSRSDTLHEHIARRFALYSARIPCHRWRTPSVSRDLPHMLHEDGGQDPMAKRQETEEWLSLMSDRVKHNDWL